MTGFSHSSLVLTELPELEEDLPYLFDDCSLAFYLRIRTKSLWWIIRNTNLRYKMCKIPKKHGMRIIHKPDKSMKAILRRANARILDPLQERLGPHVTAYRTGLSARDAVIQHIPPCPVCDTKPLAFEPPAHNCPRKGTCIQMDLKDFFPSTRRAWVRNYFKSLGYSHNVSSYLAALFTVTNLPNPAYKTGKEFNPEIRKFFSGVPQGSPASGAICNLVADHRLDTPLRDLLNHWDHVLGLPPREGMVYTRYSDDLTITCRQRLSPQDQNQLVSDIIRVIQTTGYFVNPAKTRVASSPRHRRKLLGMTFNRHPNYRDQKYKRLRAITYNCSQHGFHTQFEKAGFNTEPELRDWLRGTIGWVHQINPRKGQKLLDEFHRATKKQPT